MDGTRHLMPLFVALSASRRRSPHIRRRSACSTKRRVFACSRSWRGPAVTPRARGVLRPFAHVLVGVAHGSVDSFGERTSVNGFLVQPGGGVDVMLLRSLSLRVGADARRLWFEGK